MHQNLKTTFCLNLENEYQTIAASKFYGTFYTLHAKFKYKTDTKIPDSCDLYIQNFSGFITLGIESANSNIELIHDPIMSKPSFVMYVKLKALFAEDKKTIKNLKLVNNLNTHPSIREFSKDTNLKIEVLFDKIEGFDENDLTKSTIIDNNYERDGESLLRKNYTEPINERSKQDIYKDYFNLSDNEHLKISKSTYGVKTTTIGRTSKKEAIDKVTLPDGTKHNVIEPYPCYLSYVQFK